MLFTLMIEFRGTSEKDWMETDSQKIKMLLDELKNYKKEGHLQCPLMAGK